MWVKNESSRLGLPAFKILGATWAVYRELRRRIGAQDQPVGGFDAIEDRLASIQPLRLVASTEGNHGRAVARVASWLGLTATILIPVEAGAQKIEAIRSEGAEVVEIDGSYDETVERVRGMAGPENLLIQDTAWDGYETIPRWIVEGYARTFRARADRSWPG